MKNKFLITLIFLLFGGKSVFSQASKWKVDKDYSIVFSTKSADGIFKTFTANIVFDEAKLSSSKFEMTIDVNSINTGNGLQNKHAVGKEWLEAAKYPNIKFTSISFEKTSSGFSVTGKLQIKDVIKDISIPFTFKKSGNKKGKFIANFSVDRTAYHVGESDGDVGNTIKISAEISVSK